MSRLAVIAEAELRLVLRDVLLELLEGVVSPTPAPSEVMTRAEAAAFLRCSLAQLDRLARLSALPWYRLGDSRRFLRSDLLAWMTEQARATEPTDPLERSEP